MAQFGVVDTVIMLAFVLATLAIGVVYGLRDRSGQKLLISRQMNMLPVSFSMMATFMSAILIIGTPSEVFYFGLKWMVAVLSFPVAALLGTQLFLPIFYRLQLTSVYEYLGLRYNCQWVTRVTTVAFMVQNVLYTAIVLVAPSIVLSSVTGLDAGLAMALIGIIGTTYTAFGGFRAVVWADVLQAVIMFTGIVAIIVKGCINAGGLSAMLDINRENGRLTMYSWNFDPLERSSFWNVFFGQSVMWTSILGTSQPAVQRALSLPTYTKSAVTVTLGNALIMLICTLACTSGLAIFATYADCDPLAAGITQRRDQVVPHFVSEQFSQVPGLAGLFLACVLSGALSTVSSSLNSLAAVLWEDFLKHCACARHLSDTQRAWILRGSACGFGLVTLALAFLATNMGSVIQVATGVYGGVAGPILAVFILAVLVPFSNPAGAVSGLVAGLVMSLWISFGSFLSELPPPTTLPGRTDGCDFNTTVPSTAATLYSNATLLHSDDAIDIERSPLQTFYSTSYFLFSLLGFVTALVVGVIVSALTGGSWIEVDPDHLCPLVRRVPAGKKPRAVNGGGKANPAFQMEGKYAPKQET